MHITPNKFLTIIPEYGLGTYCPVVNTLKLHVKLMYYVSNTTRPERDISSLQGEVVMALNDDVKKRLEEVGIKAPYNESLKKFFSRNDIMPSNGKDGENGHTPVLEWIDDTYLKIDDKEPVDLQGMKGEDGRDASVPTWILGEQERVNNRINVFCPNLVCDSNGLLTIYLTTTGKSTGTPLFKDLSQCAIASTVFSINEGTANNEVPIIAIRDYNSNTGLLRLVAKRARGSLILSSSAFTEGSSVRLNLTVSGDKRT